MRRPRLLRSSVWLLTLGLLIPSAAGAQEIGASTSPSELFGESSIWEYEIAAYVWYTGASGTGAILGEEYPIDLGTPDLWKPFDTSLSFSVEARRGAWAISADAALVKTEDDVTFSGGQTGTFRIENTIPGGAVSYRLLAGTSTRLEGLVGFRVSDLKLRASADTIAATAQKTWFDPLGGLRLRGALGSRVVYTFRGDVGGFGLGSDLAWNAQGAVVYQTSARLVVGVGYRYYDTDYSSGSGDDLFAFNAHQNGLLVGLALLL